MELRHLRYFLSIAEHQSFRAAAEELLVSQPTLSQQMKDLEKELGSPILERAGRGIRLTQAGVVFADHARRCLNVLAEGQSAIDEFDDLLRGRLRVGVVQTVGAYLMPEVVAKFTRDYPKIELRVEERSGGEIETGVADGTLDLGISFKPTGARELDVNHLFDEQMVLVVSRKHPFAGRKRIRLADLRDERLCLLTRDYCTRRIVDQSFSEAGVAPDVAVEVTSVEACVNIAAAGGPATILPQLAVSRKSVSAIGIQQPVIKRTVCVLQGRGHAKLQIRSEFLERVLAAVN